MEAHWDGGRSLLLGDNTTGGRHAAADLVCVLDWGFLLDALANTYVV